MCQALWGERERIVGTKSMETCEGLCSGSLGADLIPTKPIGDGISSLARKGGIGSKGPRPWAGSSENWAHLGIADDLLDKSTPLNLL